MAATPGANASTPHPGPDNDAARLAWSIGHLRDTRPESSASETFTKRQVQAAAAVVIVVALSFVFRPRLTVIVLLALTLAVYAGTIALRIYLGVMSVSGSHHAIRVDRTLAMSVPDDALPIYSVIIPAYREPEVLLDLLAAIDRIDYPKDRLELLLALEADDVETIAAAARWAAPYLRVVVVPAAAPRTKPKALNYALLHAVGELVTIYDAEDDPEPLQLRRAAIALAQHPELGCVQAQLAYFNGDQNVITRWFALEYAMWFEQFLPGLVRLQAPVPLGGTSNHFRRDLLVAVGGWDPFNVTEDADLGVRLHRAGSHVGVLESVTLEEANSDFVNWAKQRSRWYKGYLQTWLVNLRHPVATARAFGPRGFVIFNLFVGGTPLLALLNPLFWSLTLVWFVLRPAAIESVFPAPLLYLGVLIWLVGNILLVYSFVLAALSRNGSGLLRAALLVPLYFVMMSLAAAKGAYQLLSAASYWEKTTHGLAGS